MFDPAALKAFSDTLTVNVLGLTAEGARAALVQTAAAERDRVIAQEKATYRQIVDGTEGAPLDAVRPDGMIVFVWSHASGIVADTYGALVNRSPRVTGRYIAGIKIFADGTQTSIDAIPADAQQIVLAGTVPYARRIERGRGGGQSSQKANPVFQETAIVAQHLYGAVAQIEFLYLDAGELPGVEGYAIKGAAGHRRRRGRVEADVRYPAISIKPRMT